MKQIIDSVQSFLIMGLVLFGIIGLSYRTFKDEGWLASLGNRLFDAVIDHPMITIPAIIVIGVVGKLWHGHQVEKGHTSKLPNFFLYAVMASGAYFLWVFISTGSL